VTLRLAVVFCALACQRATPTPPPVADADASGWRFAAVPRVVAFGDVHGDLSAARAALQLGGAVDADGHWTGGALTVVQTGDQLDRGDDERAILDWFEQLTHEAAAAGGRFLPLNGNHETMNVAGDYRYVTSHGFQEFMEVTPKSAAAINVPLPARGRAEAFMPAGRYARLLAERPLVAMVGDNVFVHGGVLPEHVRYGIGRLNAETRRWMRGEGPAPAGALEQSAPVWTRAYSEEPVDAAECAQLKEALTALGAARMVVGHTTQKQGITSACDGQVYRIDVGLARYNGTTSIQVLEILGSRVNVLRAERGQ
jgi:hypothetical protein